MHYGYRTVHQLLYWNQLQFYYLLHKHSCGACAYFACFNFLNINTSTLWLIALSQDLSSFIFFLFYSRYIFFILKLLNQYVDLCFTFSPIGDPLLQKNTWYMAQEQCRVIPEEGSFLLAPLRGYTTVTLYRLPFIVTLIVTLYWNSSTFRQGFISYPLNQLFVIL